MIPEEATKAAEVAYRETLTELRLSEGGGFKVASQNRRALQAALEAAAPHMMAGDGGNSPGWDDRKALSGLWQEHAPLPVEGLSERVYEALIEVAAWGYQRRIDEEL